MSFFEELKRRNVVRVGIAYAIAAWIILQATDVIGEILDLPQWGGKLILLMLGVGFLLALFFAWAYELTPEGLKRESEVDRSQSIAPKTGRKLDFAIIALLAVGLAYFIYESRFMDRGEPGPAGTTTPTTAPAGDASAAAGDEKTAPPQPPADGIEPNSIAVLPFVNMSNDPDQEFFSDGISEELLNLLVRVDGLEVASRTSSFAFKGSQASIPDIARKMKVANILEGSVRRAGDQVRITAQLIDTTNDRHLWSDSYDRSLDDIFAVQDEIANAIVAALRTELGLELAEGAIEVSAATANMNAYELYLRGREAVLARRDLQGAVEDLERAVELDPQFAEAWSMLATAAHLVPGWHRMDGVEQSVWHARARQAADRALEIDPEQSLAWAIKGMQAQYAEGGPAWEQILPNLDRAIELDPNNATAWLWRGIRYSELGYFERARSDYEKCVRLDPAYQNCLRHLSVILGVLGEYETSIGTYVKSARMSFLVEDASFAPIFFAAGDPMGGVLAANLLRSRFPDFPFDEWVDALEYPEREHLSSAPAVISWLEKTEALPVGVSENLLTAVGAYDRISPDTTYVNTWLWFPTYERFRQSADFQRIIHALNIPAYWEAHGLPDGCRRDGERYFCETPADRMGTTP